MSEDGDRVIWVGIGALVTALAALWLTGALAAALLGGGWDSLPLAQLPATGMRLLSNLGDPADAWPAGRRRAMPETVAFWLCALLVAAVMAVLAIGAMRAAANLVSICRTPDPPGGSRPPVGPAPPTRRRSGSDARNPDASSSAITAVRCWRPGSASR